MDNSSPQANQGASTPAGSSSTQPQPSTPARPPQDIVSVLGNLLKTQIGEPISNERMSHLLLSNMETLVKQGKLTQSQILQQLKVFADKHKTNTAANGASKVSLVPSTPAPTSAPPSQSSTPHPGFRMPSEALPTLASLQTSTSANGNDSTYPISATLTPMTPTTGAAQWTQARPTLTGGLSSGRVVGAPPQVARPGDASTLLTLDDTRPGLGGSAGRRKNTPADQSMRRSIQDLVASIDPNVKVEPEVEDLLLSIADEFIDSVTNFSCRLAKHRGGDTLEVKDLQLHLERNHNIRIPGFASDDTRIALSSSSLAPYGGTTAGSGSGRKGQATGAAASGAGLRNQRLNQVAQAKRDGKLI
ncbi:transcription initiation factor TFIID subunit A-domain-containing protein [Lentinula raphanica]|nr:transcription initiation factor TFIID subunit A-domain-containing protein [Lentinula raphanica]